MAHAGIVVVVVVDVVDVVVVLVSVTSLVVVVDSSGAATNANGDGELTETQP